MGALAALIDWARRVGPTNPDQMVAFFPHRETESLRRVTFDHAVLTENLTDHTAQSPSATNVGHLGIVGDLRLWNRRGLRSRAGGDSASSGMTDRRLLLEAYRRTGISFLDDVDGDFAFVIWDDRERRVIAVRDRFGMKPLFFERTPTGIRFASEPKQLAVTSARPIEPCARSISEYITGIHRETRFTFFDGIERVRPSTALIVDSSGEQVVRYWNPSSTNEAPGSPNEVAEGLRERLADSVHRRLATATGAVSHLSGGLDSSTIASAAHVLADRGDLPAPFQTASAVFPGHSIDESIWINEIASKQPFAHHDYAPAIDDIESYEADMWIGDQPRVNRIRGMWTETAAIGSSVGADLVLTGIGGDEVLDESQLLIDRLRRGAPMQRLRDGRAYATWTGNSVASLLGQVARDTVPYGVKRAVHKWMPRRAPSPGDLVRRELRESLENQPVELAPFEFGFPTPTQNGVVGSVLHPSIAWINELQEAAYASRGLGLSQPYLDRTVVEYVASIRAGDRPFDGRSKNLARIGFADWLPRSVLDRRARTFADDYLDLLFAQYAPHYVHRYPAVSDAAVPYLDADRYTGLLREIAVAPPSFLTRESLWSAWTVMTWIDGLRHYRENGP